jgi:copper chaperone CopZ
MKSIIIKVTGMHCAGCEMNVQDMVSELPGVKKVKADFKKGEVAVEYDEAKTTVEAIKAKIVEAGYGVE